MNKQNFSWLGLGVVVLGILFMIIGIFRNETTIVFTKAIQICLECIGIG